MGLLDEAIREHLELKRRRGGDATEIAREEREALDPVLPGPAGFDDGALDGEQAEQEPEAGEFSSVGEETAELDMQAVLEADEMLTEEHHTPVAASPAGDEELDWDAPSTTEHGPPELDPGQERLSFE
jgi:hypothetical protein